MSRILIDLTDLENWSGNHGGIQRVVYGLAKNFYLPQAALEPSVAFITFNNQTKGFQFTDFGPIYKRVENILPATSSDIPETQTAHKDRLRQNLKKVPGLVAAVQLARKTRNGSAASAPATTESNVPPVAFKQDDIVLVLGKPWDNLDIQRTLTKEKALHKFKLVQVVYDLIICLQPHLQNPALYDSYKEHMSGAAATSDLMLAISKCTAQDLINFCKQEKIEPPKVEVIRLGDTINLQSLAKLEKPDSRIAEDFIACVGTIEIRKNHTLLYYAYRLAHERGVKLPQLVIVGSRGWLSGDVQHLIGHDPTLRERVIILDKINDEGLAWLYKHCLFTIYPSMYEGWGLPIAESLAYGKLCLASNTSSMPEIAGDLIDYFSPYSPDRCLEKIQQYLNPELRHKKEQGVAKGYKPTAWAETFKQVVAYLE